ncbi:MAG: GNAT family N-acetyltransferase [Nocardioides sp.]|nr:GNAT family N-acetyltransferase [Nocardioides sp.]
MSHDHSGHDHGQGPTADVSVRVAWVDDADAIAGVQVRAWPHLYADLVPAEALPTDPAPLAQHWREALTRPSDARNRVLVALERNRVVGFTLTSPASDPDCDPIADGELGEITLDPDERGKGHGSRLLQAAVDTLAADRFTRAVTWVIASDDASRGFLDGAGWAPDTAHRELDLDGTGRTTVKQVRLHTSIGE